MLFRKIVPQHMNVVSQDATNAAPHPINFVLQQANNVAPQPSNIVSQPVSNYYPTCSQRRTTIYSCRTISVLSTRVNRK